MEIKIKIINQLSDNYTYVIYNSKDKIAVVVDPAESKPIIEYLQKNNLLLVGMLITHHHSDHTSGIKDLPYTWYNTPNIHFFTLKDFQEMCKESKINIEKSIGLTNQNKQFEITNNSYFPNLIVNEAIFLLSRRTFEPIKIKSKQKIFTNPKIIIN